MKKILFSRAGVFSFNKWLGSGFPRAYLVPFAGLDSLDGIGHFCRRSSAVKEHAPALISEMNRTPLRASGYDRDSSSFDGRP